jgi:long-subunit fatty acid transport protein
MQGTNLILGCLLKLDKSLQIGFAYHSGIKDVITSEYRLENTTASECIEGSFSGNIVIPAQFSIGVSVRPIEKWLLVYDFSKILWSGGIVSDYHGQPGELPFPVLEEYEIRQRDIVNHRLGTEFSIIMSRTVFFLRGGLFWERQLFVDSDDETVWVNGFSLGLGVQLFTRLRIDLAYMNQRAGWREISFFSSEIYPESGFRNHIFGLSASYLFGTSAR